MSGRHGRTYLFRAVWPITEDGLDQTLAELVHLAGPMLREMLTEGEVVPVGSWSFRIQQPEGFRASPQLVAECVAERWVDPVRSKGRRARHLNAPASEFAAASR